MKLYKAKSLAGAEMRVRELQRQLREANEILERWAMERKLLAKLAAKGPCFDNPLIVFDAEKIRDGILKNCGLAPDGKFLNGQ